MPIESPNPVSPIAVSCMWNHQCPITGLSTYSQIYITECERLPNESDSEAPMVTESPCAARRGRPLALVSVFLTQSQTLDTLSFRSR